MTGDRLDPRLIELVPPLAALAPPAIVIDKVYYSPFKESVFLRTLGRLKTDALAISGGVLHSWGPNLFHHPYAHFLVPGGGIAGDGNRWIACRPAG